MVGQPRRWWGQAWSAILDAAGPSGTRAIQRGQALARRGAVDDLRITPGRVTAQVVEDRDEVATITIACSVPDAGVWERAIDALADELRFTAALIDGELPEGIDEVLSEVGLTLIPTWSEVEITCSCGSELCRHVAAAHTAAGIAIDRDPFLLVQLRGGDRAHLLQALRERRGISEPTPTVVDVSRGLSGARGDLEAIVLHPMPVDDPARALRHLGPPPGVDDETALIELVERAAGAAWRLAAGDGSEAADEELLLAELRAQRVATPGSLGEALGRDPEQLREELDELYAAGRVMRTGSGERTRYRAGSL